MAYPTTTTHPRVYPYTSIMAAPYSCDPTGAADCAAAIEQLKSNQANVGAIHVPVGTFKISTNLTIPVGMSLVFEKGGTFAVTVGITLTINGYIVAGPWQVFSGAGTVSIANVNKIVHGEWTGSSGITVTGVTTFASIPVGPASNPTTDNQLARKAYVDAQMLGSVTAAEIQKQTYVHATAGGTVDVITATVSPVPASLTDGLKVCLAMAGANTSATPTLNLNALSAKTIVKGSNQALVAGDIPGADFRAEFIYDLSLTKWVLINPAYAVSVVAASAVKVVQIVYYQTGAVATGTTIIPWDDTIPQKTEGDEYMTLAITPTSATNKLKIEVLATGAQSAGNDETMALFQDTTAGALAAVSTMFATANRTAQLSLTHIMTTGTVVATTFKVRIGPSSAATYTFNGTAGGRLFGGVCVSSIVITEYVP